jgi:hypothetical protein
MPRRPHGSGRALTRAEKKSIREGQQLPTGQPALFSGFQIILRLASRHPLVAMLFAGCVMVPVFAWPVLSYSGFCLAQMQFLSDDDYFDVAISQTIHLTSHPVETRGPNGVGYKYVRPIQYKDVAEFREANPTCCKFVPHNSGLEVGYVSFFDQLLGLAARSVHLTYKLNYLDADGHRQSVTTAAQMVIGNCGRVLNTAARI